MGLRRLREISSVSRQRSSQGVLLHSLDFLEVQAEVAVDWVLGGALEVGEVKFQLSPEEGLMVEGLD